jgi:hypothetical protein
MASQAGWEIEGDHKHITGNRDSLRCISRTRAFTNDGGAYGGRGQENEPRSAGATERARISRQNPELARDLPPLLLVPHAPAHSSCCFGRRVQVEEAGAGGGRQKSCVAGRHATAGNWGWWAGCVGGLPATELPGPTRQGRVVLHLGP